MMNLDKEPTAVDPELLDRLTAADNTWQAAEGDPADRSNWEAEFLRFLDETWSPVATSGDAASLPTRIGRYEIVRELGRGGFGVVYLARDPELGGREIALKIPRPGLANSPEVRRRFTREALAVAGLEHPNIVPVHDARTVGPVAYIISAYCPGPSLAAWLKARTEPVPPRLAARLVAGLTRGVEHAHTRKILHRDLKPANVMLGPGGDAESAGLVPRLTDFGLAKLADDSLADETRTGLILGSAPYMAPEQAATAWGEVGPATDVYALGVTLYEILVGRPPFGGGSPLETLQQVLSLDPVPPHLFRADLPRDLETICLKALRKNPHHRYPTAAAFGADLNRFLDGEAILARPPSVAERGWRWTQRHPVATTSLAAITLFIGLITLEMAWSNSRLRSVNTQLRREVDRADRHAREVDRQRQLIADREAITDRHLHAARLNLARQAIEAGQPERAQAVLSDVSAASGSRRSDFVWRYLWQLSRRELALWGRHDGLISGVILSPDGNTLASSDLAGRVHLWDVATGRLEATLGEATGTADHLAFTPDGAVLAVAGLATSRADQVPRVTLYQVATGAVLARLDLADTIKVEQVGFDGAGRTLLAVVNDLFAVRVVRGWSLAGLAGPALAVQPRFRIDGCSLVAPTADGRTFWTVAGVGRLDQRDCQTGQVVRTLPVDTPWVYAVGLSRDGRFLAAAIPPARVLLWDLDQSCPPRIVTDEQVVPDQLIFTGDAGSLLVVMSGVQARLIRLADGVAHEILPLDRERRGQLRYAVSPDGRWLASCGEYHPGGMQPVVLWDVATGRLERTFAGRRKFEHLVFDAQSRSLLLSNDYDVAIWHPHPAPERFERFEDHNDEVWAAAFAPDGATVATGGDDDRVRFWNPRTGARGPVCTDHDATVSTLAWHPEGRILASGSLKEVNNLKLWEAESGKLIKTLVGHTDKVRAIAYSPDGKLLASGGTDRLIRIWEGLTGEPLGVLQGHTNLIRGLAFARDGRTLTSVGDDGVVRVWDLVKQQPLMDVRKRYKLSAVTYSPDGRTLATADEGGFIYLRDTTAWQIRRELRSDDREIRTLAFSPDGETLVSAGLSQTIRFWDPITGHPLMELKHGTSHQINALAFSPDGSLLIAADHGGRALVFHGPPQ